MKLYDCSPAPSPRRVRIFLAEKGMEIPLVQVDLMSGEQLREPFRSINPQCEVPALELDNGTVITEIVGICRYLEEIRPDPPLLGRTPEEKALVAMWEHKVEFEGFLATAEAFRNFSKFFADRALPGPENFAQIPELVERGRRRTARFLDTLDTRLADSPYIAGDSFTSADISALVAVDFADRIKMSIPEGHRHLRRWHDEVSARPSAKA